jgi:hypothetical protein
VARSLDKAWIFAGAIFVAVFLGYFLRDASSVVPAAGDARPSPRPASHPAPREVRPMARPAFTGELGLETQDRIRDLESLAASDLQKALTKLPAFRDTDLLSLALTAIAKGRAQADPEAAAEWVAGLASPDDQVSAALGLVPVWAARDPEACLVWASARPAGNLREVSLVELADTWVDRQPADALTRFLSMESEAGTERGLHAIVAQWVLDDPDKAVEHIAGLDAAHRRDEFLETALVSLTNQDPDMAWTQATRFADASRTEHVRSTALEAIAETRPQLALKLVESTGNPPAFLRAVARGWASRDPAAAASWISTLADPSLMETLRKEITE